jgi:NitT/TauT family transport system substrate-binding protein
MSAVHRLGRRLRILLAVGATAAVVTAGCSGAATQVPPVPLRMILQWVPQAQFAGYYAALRQGYWEEEGLDIEIVPGGPDVAPQEVGSQPDGPEFTISWLPRVLEAREEGSDLVNIAQVFQRSGTLSVAWRGSGITSPRDFAGKRVGVWGSGLELEVTAAATKYGLEAGRDYETIIQDADMDAFLDGEIDVAEAMIYNEYAQVLETVDPATGQLYRPEDLNVIDYNNEDTAMLQDGIFARASWLAEGGNEDLAVRFLTGAFRGWIFCRVNPGTCVEYALDAGTALGASHQAWQMNEIGPLIWPSPAGIGIMDPRLYDQTVEVATDAGFLAAPPSADAYRTDLATRALGGIEGDTRGVDFRKGTVEVVEGGA